jgi:hypothetical protein
MAVTQPVAAPAWSSDSNPDTGRLWPDTLNPMEKPTDDGGQIAFTETTSGMHAGLWMVPIAGFRWAEDYRPFDQITVPESEGTAHDPGPWLIPQGDEARRYPMLRRGGLLDAIDRLSAGPTAEHIQAFADRWGHLGVQVSLVPTRRVPGVGVVSSGQMTWGESLAAWRTELFAFADLRRLWRAISILSEPDSWGPSQVREAKGLIAERIHWLASGGCSYHSRFEVDGVWSEWHQHIHHPTDVDGTSVASHLGGKNSFEAARLHLHRRVNRQMSGSVSPAVLPYVGGVIRFFPASLISAAWLRFAQELAGAAGRERECEHCRLPFLPRRRDQRFCGRNCQEASAYRRRRTNPV